VERAVDGADQRIAERGAGEDEPVGGVDEDAGLDN
jgi:hypothetical protein